jgi:hypothetical protein
LRVYINSFDAEQLWSVDDGDVSTEQRFDSVIVIGSSYTMQDLSKRGSKTEPCCWIECFGTLRTDGDRKAIIS